MDEIFSLEKNPNLPMEELTAMLEELRRWVGGRGGGWVGGWVLR